MNTGWNRFLTALRAAGLAAVAVVAAVGAAPDVSAPRIVAAAMLDVDGDARADRVRLTYSERVRHAADRDGRYPFRVAGYRIRSVGAAGGKAIVLSLVERAAPDGAVRPAVSYRRTRSGAVVDRVRNQALSQVFRATRAHAGRPPQPPRPLPPGPVPVADADGDGAPDADDCAPGDPAIRPGAPDEPDLAFVDANCDGIDGTESKAVFASPEGSNANPGTRSAPKREIDAAVAAAAGKGMVVLAAAGSYGKVNAASGVGVYGGYDPKSWKRSLVSQTTIAGTSEGVFASSDTNVVLQLLTVEGSSGAQPGASAYGIRAISGSKLALQRVRVFAGVGSSGADGKPGAAGGDGRHGEKGACNSYQTANGGVGGTSPVGRPGGRGGNGGPGHEDPLSGVSDGRPGQAGTLDAPGGAGGAKGNPGKRGRDGAPGAPGAAGARGNGGTATTASAGADWRGAGGESGSDGQPGNGGGGGGGGGAQTGIFVIDGSGNGGGGGGGGSQGGQHGSGGGPGGGSFGIYLHNSFLTVSDGSSIQAGDGGAGGRGGNGGLPGAPGSGGKGALQCADEVGAGGNGGPGGPGGPGGGGGGGAGGPSVGVMKLGTSTAALADTTVKVGAPGSGGAPGTFGAGAAVLAQPGIARPVFP